jgi:hypothetical protein
MLFFFLLWLCAPKGFCPFSEPAPTLSADGGLKWYIKPNRPPDVNTLRKTIDNPSPKRCPKETLK